MIWIRFKSGCMTIYFLQVPPPWNMSVLYKKSNLMKYLLNMFVVYLICQ